MSRLTVQTMPSLPVNALLRGTSGALPPPLDRSGVTFWHAARTALWQAIRALGLERGQAVALPAFCCGSELEPFLHAGLEPRFFRATRRLDPEPESFEEAIRGASAALATHYFGFPADLAGARSACQRAGVPLIEDCAHALFARDGNDWLGMHADVAVFSLWKTLPVPDGGALVLNVAPGSPIPAADAPPARDIARRTRRLVMHGLLSHEASVVRGIARLTSSVKRGVGLGRRPAPRDADVFAEGRFRPEHASTGMSARALGILRHTDPDAVRDKRRACYRRLADALADVPGLELLRPELDDWACPLFLPVIVEDVATFQARLDAARLGAKRLWLWFHPRVPWERFAFEARLKRTIFGFPVHQSLGNHEMQRLLGAVRSWAHR